MRVSGQRERLACPARSGATVAALTLIAMYSRVELAQSSRTRFVPSSVSVCLSVSVGPPPGPSTDTVKGSTHQVPRASPLPRTRPLLVPNPPPLVSPRVREVAILKASSSDVPDRGVPSRECRLFTAAGGVVKGLAHIAIKIGANAGRVIDIDIALQSYNIEPAPVEGVPIGQGVDVHLTVIPFDRPTTLSYLQ